MTSAEEELDQLVALVSAVGDALARGGPLDAVLQACCQALVDHVGAAFARIWLLKPKSAVLRLHASAGQYTHLHGKHGRIRLGDLEIGYIAQARQPVLTNDVLREGRITDHEWARREGIVSFAGHPLLVDGRAVGVIALFSKRVQSKRLLRQLSWMANGLALYIGREEAERKLSEARPQLKKARAEERLRLARDLHDAVSQSIVGITMSAQAGLRIIDSGKDHPQLRAALEQVLVATRAALDDLRGLIFGLLPESLERGSLTDAIRDLAATVAASTGLKVELTLGAEPALDPEGKEALFRITQEALTNVAKHARAHRVEIGLRATGDGGWELSITDNGVGLGAPAAGPGHLGLESMRQRAAAQGWQLSLAGPPGAGTVVRVGPAPQR